LEAVAPKQLLPEMMIAEARKELFEIREGILTIDGSVSWTRLIFDAASLRLISP